MPALQRNQAMYQRLADAIRTSIEDGSYPPGALLPSEAALMDEYGVSRPTVRQALAVLRAQGLVAARMGKGSYVRSPQATPDLTLTRSAPELGADWQPNGEPQLYRADADTATAALLDLDQGHPCFMLAQPYRHTSGATLVYRRTLPFDTAADTALENEPFPATRDELVSTLTDTYGDLIATEYVSARMPSPDEATTLRAAEATPVLDTTRISATSDGRPLLAETITANANTVRLAYPLT